MKKLKIKDKKRRALENRFFYRRFLLKYCLNKIFIYKHRKFYKAVFLRLYSLPKDSNHIRILNRCNITNRSHAVHRKFKLSRIMIRELAFGNKLSGLTKSTW